MSNRKNRYATTRSKIIAAIIAEEMFFSREEDASEWLGILDREFIISKDENEVPNSRILWVRGFGITTEEKRNGALGNYMRVGVCHEDGQFVIKGERFKSSFGPPETSYAAKRKKGRHQHPNWGHPVLRGVRKGKVYTAREEARADLDRLQREYPKVSIRPKRDVLYCIVFSREYGHKNTRKMVFEVVEGDPGWRIDCYENRHQAPIARRKAFTLPTVPKGIRVFLLSGKDG